MGDKDAMTDEVREVLKAQIEATAAAIKVLVSCLERNGLLEKGHYCDALRDHIEISMEAMSPMAQAVLADIRQSLLQ